MSSLTEASKALEDRLSNLEHESNRYKGLPSLHALFKQQEERLTALEQKVAALEQKQLMREAFNTVHPAVSKPAGPLTPFGEQIIKDAALGRMIRNMPQGSRLLHQPWQWQIQLVSGGGFGSSEEPEAALRAAGIKDGQKYNPNDVIRG